MIRKARAQDFASAFEFAEKAKVGTIYENIPLDRATCRALWTRSVMDKRMFAMVVAEGDRICGFLLGAIVPFDFNAHESYATDVFYMVEEGNSGGITLLAEFTKWAESHPKVRMVIMGVTSGNGKNAGPLYEKFHMRPVGGMYARMEMS